MDKELNICDYIDLVNFSGIKNSNATEKHRQKFCTAPLYQQVIDWLFKKLDFYYPTLRIEIFSDGSGHWFENLDYASDGILIDFDNLNQAIEKALEHYNELRNN